jgi:hypothetical protein
MIGNLEKFIYLSCSCSEEDATHVRAQRFTSLQRGHPFDAYDSVVAHSVRRDDTRVFVAMRGRDELRVVMIDDESVEVHTIVIMRMVTLSEEILSDDIL